MFRLPLGKYEIENGNPKDKFCKPKVLLVHGLNDASDSWFVNYEEKSLPFILVNSGYDVWVINSRGNKHSRRHVYLDPEKDEEKFWNFTFEEMGTKDVPAVLEFISKHTNCNNKITYIGHSQGTAQIFAAISLNPNYFKQKLNGIIALGPITKMVHYSSFLLRQFTKNKFEKVFDYMKIREVFNSKYPVNKVNKILCDFIPYICNEALELISDETNKNNDNNKFLVWAAHFPSGTSSKNIAHYSQMLRDKKFEDFNRKEYNLDQIHNFNIALFIGKDDKLSTVADNRQFRNILLKNNSLYFYKEYDNFGHATFFLNKNNEYIDDVLRCTNHFNNELIK